MAVYLNFKYPYLLSFSAVVGVAAICFPFTELIGYRDVALILLLVVSVLAMVLSLRPVLLAALLSALIWDFFFIPPIFKFDINASEDILMLLMYFIVALLNGVFSARIRRFEAVTREKEAKSTTLRLYDTLFNALAHELRTPITTILGASDNLLAQNVKYTEGVKLQLAEEINQAAERLQRMVSNLLNMSRIESGFVQPKLDWCDLGELIFTVKNNLEKELVGRVVNVDLSNEIELVKLDFGLMEQALHNILHNAAKFTPEGGTIHISAIQGEESVKIIIEDGGLGFSKEDLAHVFERFYRGKNNKTTGIGLGLSISKDLVAVHKGRISVENVAGSGARFTITIPTETNFWKSFNEENSNE